jgi:hypothetical protein
MSPDLMFRLDPRWHELFARQLAEYELDDAGRSDLRNVILFCEQIRSRPFALTDPLALALSCANIIEAFYAQLAARADAEYLANSSPTVRALPGEDSNSGGGAG